MKRQIIVAIAAFIAAGAAYGQDTGSTYVALKASGNEATFRLSSNVARTRLVEQCKRDYQGEVTQFSHPTLQVFTDSGADVLGACGYPVAEQQDRAYIYEPMEGVGLHFKGSKKDPLPTAPNLALPMAQENLRNRCAAYVGSELVSQSEPTGGTSTKVHSAAVAGVCKRPRF
jgi:hypothetical protein